MKKLTTKIISFILTLSMIFSMNIPAFASETENFSNPQTSYIVISSQETEFGTIYYVKEDGKPQTRTLWDILDIAMAGYSWSKLLQEPSWGNFGWAVLDTAALLPLLPSTAYVREGGKVLLKADDFAKFAKTDKGKAAIKSAMKTYKLASVTYDAKQLQSKFKHAIDFGVKGNYSVAKANEFKNALAKVVNNAAEIYKTNYHGDAIIYIKDGLGVITKTDGTFVSGWKLSSEQLKFHRTQLKIK
ncbi:MAG: colicin D domain-containing protein [Filifactoraceae bacterium]